MTERLARRPGGIEAEERRKREQEARPVAAAGEDLASAAGDEDGRHDRRERDPGRVARGAEARAPLAAERAPVREPLAQEGLEAGGAALEDDDVRVVPEANAVRRERAVHLRLPEPVAVELPRPLEKLAPVGAVVAGDVGVLTAREGAHVARVAAEVLGPVARPQPLARLDRAGDDLVGGERGAEALGPVGGGAHGRDGQR